MSTGIFDIRLKRTALIRWTPNRADLVMVAISWVLVVATLRAATSIITPERGFLYFLVYGLLAATVFGLGIPLFWTVVVRGGSLADLGLTTKRWAPSVVLQALFASLLFASAHRDVSLPSIPEFVPLLALALTIGLFEAVFWRGWVLLRLEESFGLIPAVLLGSALYAVYHVGYAMDPGEMVFLFFIGVMFAVVFLLTRNVLILWPVFQPMGQLVTLIDDGLKLPILAAVGFGEVLIVMLAMIWFAGRYAGRAGSRKPRSTLTGQPVQVAHVAGTRTEPGGTQRSHPS